MTVTYTRAPEVEMIANRLIAKHHTHLLEFGNVRIEYVFRSEATKTNGRTVLGKARKLTGLNAFLTLGDDAPEGRPDEDTPEVEPFFVMEIAADSWAVLTPTQRIALVDHELAHFKVGFDDDMKVRFTIAPHDVEAFVSEVERHGMWKPEIEDFVKAAVVFQPSLFEKATEGDE